MNCKSRLWRAVQRAFRPALQTALWLTKMMLPITLSIAWLNYLGVIARMARWCTPAFEWIGLPGESALVFITSAFSNLYAAIAVIATLGFDYRSVVILSVMCLICHNLIIESAIQQKTGAPAWIMVLLRIGMAFVAGGVTNGLLPQEMSGALLLPSNELAPQSWSDVFYYWGKTILPLTIRLFLVVVVLNIVQNLLREYKIMDLLTIPLKPFMALFGLPRSTSFLWIIGNIVGLAYGGAALIDEVNQGVVSRRDARLLNAHLAISHSLLEDSIIFVSVGISFFWLAVPRLALALGVVWGLRLFLWWHNRDLRRAFPFAGDVT